MGKVFAFIDVEVSDEEEILKLQKRSNSWIMVPQWAGGT